MARNDLLRQIILENEIDGQAILHDVEMAELAGVSRCSVCRVRREYGIMVLPQEYEPKPDYTLHRYEIEISFDYLAWLNREKDRYREATGTEPTPDSLKWWVDNHADKSWEVVNG